MYTSQKVFFLSGQFFVCLFFPDGIVIVIFLLFRNVLVSLKNGAGFGSVIAAVPSMTKG